ncbi:ferritin-like protein [Methylovulum psychrotolerans]|uniref:ferritin-like domain-containing protein n=1 Tax=Methylovulum psychrotolerans TaxID=1704499 RepID=UPI001BFFB22E|nr:ferritin-like protein [Methylovulum psychrotolerans]MBT9099726.1 ferritin-like protein [Methylovulum psychrotolerans]
MNHTTACAKINSKEELQHYLQTALQLEHSTIPVYLTALYSIHPGTNLDATLILRAALVEEMLHLTLATNVLNAIGGKPDLAAADFVPLYPTYLPSGETDFQVSTEKFSLQAIETFLNIERPALRPVHLPHGLRGHIVHKHKDRHCHCILDKALIACGKSADMHFYSIGEFYEAIIDGLDTVYAQLGEALFSGDEALQIGPKYYYSGGGDIIVVNNLETAKAALNLIIEQGEGYADSVYSSSGEIGHYYRFQQIQKGRYYVHGDPVNQPSGDFFTVDWDAVYDLKINAHLTDYPQGTEVYQAASDFEAAYYDFLRHITDAYNGKPEYLIPAVGGMFRLKELASQLVRNPNPIQGESTNAGPTFGSRAA